MTKPVILRPMFELLDPETWTPPAGDTPKCGNNRALLKRDRWHPFLIAGYDTRTDLTTGEKRLRTVLICSRCGLDRDISPALCERCAQRPRITPDNGGGTRSFKVCESCLKRLADAVMAARSGR